MRNCFFLNVIAALLFANQSIAQCNYETITEKLTQTKLNSSFTQSKKIPALSNPLKSEGYIWLSEQAELVWQVNKPIKSTMVIKQGKINQFNRKDIRLDVAKTAAPGDLAKLFYSVANVDFAELSEQFELELNCEKSKWEVLLKPRDQQLGQFIEELRLTGADRIESFSYVEKRGDKTQVLLTHLEKSLSPKLSRYID